MNLEGVQESWEKLGKTDPMSSMLPADLRGRIGNLTDFFASGRKEIDELMKYMESRNVIVQRRQALDFGCGLGRSTQALTGYFEQVSGVDIASSLVELANQCNRYPDRCTYLVNQSNDLRVFETNSFDFIWCYGVLHMLEPRLFSGYVREFLRVLAPGGVLVFHQVAGPARTVKGLLLWSVPNRLINFYRRRKYGFEVHYVKRDRVIDLLQRSGGKLVDIREDRRTPGPTCVGLLYTVLKERTRLTSQWR